MKQEIRNGLDDKNRSIYKTIGSSEIYVRNFYKEVQRFENMSEVEMEYYNELYGYNKKRSEDE